jgi:hypothetical protein
MHIQHACDGHHARLCNTAFWLPRPAHTIVNPKLSCGPLQGHVHVNAEVGTLELQVQMNRTKNPHAPWVEDLKQLSGGERSTATVAFFLALGGCMESPFRIMDEYDVYMDAVNRRHATKALLQHALDHKHLQFVLLTPQVGGGGGA